MSAVFVGRERELSSLVTALSKGARTLVLRGPPGVGKSSLARAFAEAVRRDGAAARPVIELSLSHARDRASALSALSSALGLDLRSSDANVVFERVVRTVESAPHVLVIDDVDDAVAGLVEDLVDAVESMCVLLCSTRWLSVGADLVLDVAPLSSEDAAKLLEARVARLSSLALSRETSAAITASVDRLPLAIELLAAKVAAIGPSPVLEALSDGRLVLDGLERSIAAAFDALEIEAQRALVALSALRSSFDADAATAMIDRDSSAALAVLEQLVRASLVVARVDADRSRFSMLDSIREFAARRAGEDVRERHCAYFGRDSAPRGDDPAVWNALAKDHADLDAAWRWATNTKAIDARRAELAAKVALRLDVVLVVRGLYEAHQEVIEKTSAMIEALASSESTPIAIGLAIDLAIAKGRALALHGRLRESVAPFRWALDAAVASGDAARAVFSQANLCFVLGPLEAFDEARALGEAALDEATRLRSHRLIAAAEQALGAVEFYRGDQERAVAHYTRALASAEVVRAPRLLGIVHANYGLAEAARGAVHEALSRNALARESLAIAGDRFLLGRVAVFDAKYRFQLDDLEASEALLPAALDEAIALSDLSGELEARLTLARIAQRRAGGRDDALYRQRLAALEATVRLCDDRTWSRKLAELRAEERRDSGAPAIALSLSRDGRALEVGGSKLDLSKRGPLRKILVALVRARLDEGGRALDASAVRAAGWPGEKMLAESAAARVYMAISRLRALGLEALLQTSDEGYSLDPRANVRWIER